MVHLVGVQLQSVLIVYNMLFEYIASSLLKYSAKIHFLNIGLSHMGPSKLSLPIHRQTNDIVLFCYIVFPVQLVLYGCK